MINTKAIAMIHRIQNLVDLSSSKSADLIEIDMFELSIEEITKNEDRQYNHEMKRYRRDIRKYNQRISELISFHQYLINTMSLNHMKNVEFYISIYDMMMKLKTRLRSTNQNRMTKILERYERLKRVSENQNSNL